MKTCIFTGCDSPQFGGGYCKYHQYKRKMKGGDLFQQKPRKVTPINKESPKRKKETRRYLDVLKEYWDNAVNTKTNYCFICGELLKQREDVHHLHEREGNKLLDTYYWALVHRECHKMIHDWSVETLIKQPWYSVYLNRLKEREPFLYHKELKKVEKNRNLFGEEI